jgi:hypothetical protein
VNPGHPVAKLCEQGIVHNKGCVRKRFVLGVRPQVCERKQLVQTQKYNAILTPLRKNRVGQYFVLREEFMNITKT